MSGYEGHTSGAYLLDLLEREDRGEALSLDQQRLLDGYWAEKAEPMSPEFRQRLLATVADALADRRMKITTWRFVLFAIQWAWTGKQPTWHDYFDCATCHPWPRVQWVGPYELGEDQRAFDFGGSPSQEVRGG